MYTCAHGTTGTLNVDIWHKPFHWHLAAAAEKSGTTAEHMPVIMISALISLLHLVLIIGNFKDNCLQVHKNHNDKL